MIIPFQEASFDLLTIRHSNSSCSAGPWTWARAPVRRADTRGGHAHRMAPSGFWSDDEKRMICRQTRVPGVSVSQVARRFDVNANLVFA